MEVEEAVNLEMPSSAPIGSEHAKEVPVLEESIPIPLVHEEIVGSTKHLQKIEHPHVVQEGLDVINVPTDVPLRSEEILDAYLPVQEEDEAVQLLYTESGDIPVQGETLDPSINKEVVSTEEFPTAIDSEETILKPSEVQGNGILLRVLHFTHNFLY